ncbi:hypothetical protein SAMN04487880_3459 [Marinobacter sp. es.042]|nr:hypothetical protein SAMN04487880_3459 [Marinobacter sp. es.042]
MADHYTRYIIKLTDALFFPINIMTTVNVLIGTDFASSCSLKYMEPFE